MSYVGLFVALFLGYLFLRDSTWQGSTQLHTIMEVFATLLALIVGLVALVHFSSKKNNTFLQKGAWKTDAFEHWVVLLLIVVMGQAMFMSFSFKLFDMMFDMAHLLKKVSYIFVLTGLLISMYYLFRQAEKSTKEVIRTNEALQKEVTERKQAEEKLQARYKDLETLHGISQNILSSLDLRTILDQILDKALSVGSFDLGVIRLLDASGQTLEPVVFRGLLDPKGLRVHRVRDATTGKIIGRVMTWKEPRVVENVPDSEGLRTLKRESVQSAIMLPVRAEEEVLGVLQFGSRRPRKFQPDEVHILEAIGNQMGIAVQKARLFEKMQRNLRHIRALREIDQAITSTLDLRTVLDVLLEKIDLSLPYSAATVRLFNKQSGLLEPVACRNLDESKWKADEWKGGRGLASLVFETKAPMIIGNAQTDPRVREHEFYREHQLISYLGVPLIAKGEILGVLSFYTKEEHGFSNEEVEFLSTLAGQAAIAIHNSQLYEQTKNQAVELERSNKVRNEFLNIMSHELRTPLTVIMGYTGMIKEGMWGEVTPGQQKALGKVTSRSDELLTMINSILQATSLEAGAVKVESQEVNLGSFLDELRSSYDVPLAKELTLNWDCPSELPVLQTDSDKLKHILQNLINNAIKFTDKGHVTISARYLEGVRAAVGNGQVEFKVTDTGIGIPKEHCSFIFEMFHQVDSSETRAYGGVGLGLYIVKTFTELLGGKIDVKSEPGKGSVFTVSIPCDSCRSEVSSRKSAGSDR